MCLLPDPAAFVAAAERGINARDLEATVGVYAADATLTSLTDGAVETYTGHHQIRSGWAGYLAAFHARGFRLQKQLVNASDATIVNTWTGTLGGRTDARGMEYWRFDPDGRVTEHQMYSFLNAKPSSNLLQRARLGMAYPVTALAFLREGARARP